MPHLFLDANVQTIKPKEKLFDISAYLIIDLGRLIRKHFDAKMAGLGLTRTEWYLFSYLCFIEGCTQQEIADALDMAKGGIAKLIHNLETRGLLKRKTDKKNGKSIKRVLLTEKGRAIALKIDAESDIEVALVISSLSDNEKKTFNTLLHRIRNDLIARIEV